VRRGNDDCTEDPASLQPVDISALRSDDALVDEFAAGVLRRREPREGAPVPDSEHQLLSMLAAWVAEVRPETLTATGPAQQAEPTRVVPLSAAVPAPRRPAASPAAASPAAASPAAASPAAASPAAATPAAATPAAATPAAATPAAATPAAATPAAATPAAATPAAPDVTAPWSPRYARRLVMAAALVVLASSALAIGASDAEPGETLWAVSEVFYAERARSVQAAADVTSGLEQARTALLQGRPADAAQAIAAARERLDVVRPDEGRDDLVLEAQFLTAALADPSLLAAAPADPAPGSAGEPTGGRVLSAPGPSGAPPAAGSAPGETPDAPRQAEPAVPSSPTSARAAVPPTAGSPPGSPPAGSPPGSLPPGSPPAGSLPPGSVPPPDAVLPNVPIIGVDDALKDLVAGLPVPPRVVPRPPGTPTPGGVPQGPGTATNPAPKPLPKNGASDTPSPAGPTTSSGGSAPIETAEPTPSATPLSTPDVVVPTRAPASTDPTLTYLKPAAPRAVTPPASDPTSATSSMTAAGLSMGATGFLADVESARIDATAAPAEPAGETVGTGPQAGAPATSDGTVTPAAEDSGPPGPPPVDGQDPSLLSAVAGFFSAGVDMVLRR